MTDDALIALRNEMGAIEARADVSCFNRAWKLACEGKLKRPECVRVSLTEEGGVSLESKDARENEWQVDFLPGGQFRMTVDFLGSGDSRVRRMLKAIGEIRRR